MPLFRNYWIYSTVLAAVWAIVLSLGFALDGSAVRKVLLLIRAGYCIGWVATTIARFVYPPPKRWDLLWNTSPEPCIGRPYPGHLARAQNFRPHADNDS